MKKLLIVLFIIVGLAVSVMPLTAIGVRQGFSHPDKGWAPGLVYFGARLRMRFARYQTAAYILERAVKQWPKEKEVGDAHYWIALCYERAGAPAAAISWYKTFLERYPHHRWSNQAQRRLSTLEAETL